MPAKLDEFMTKPSPKLFSLGMAGHGGLQCAANGERERASGERSILHAWKRERLSKKLLVSLDSARSFECFAELTQEVWTDPNQAMATFWIPAARRTVHASTPCEINVGLAFASCF